MKKGKSVRNVLRIRVNLHLFLYGREVTSFRRVIKIQITVKVSVMKNIHGISSFIYFCLARYNTAIKTEDA